jgi:hypothetical protein
VLLNKYYLGDQIKNNQTALARPRQQLEDNIKMDLKEIGWGDMGWISLAQDIDRCRMLVNVVMYLQIPQNAGNFLTSSGPVHFPRRILLYGVS